MNIFVLALIPFILIFSLLILLRKTVLTTMFITWIVTVMILIFFWEINLILISASFIKGFFIATEIILIIFGAILLIEILKEKGQIKKLHDFLSTISDDKRIQAIIIAFLFSSIIEGVAGFGTPAAIAAPLLVSLGFTPILAVTIALIANSTAVSFGAAGLPIILGIGSLGFPIKEITKNVAVLHALTSILIPLSITYLVVVTEKYKNKSKAFFEAMPFAILSWISFAVPYFLIAFYIGPELPSILGGIIGLTITIFAAKNHILTPKTHKYLNKKISSKKIIIPYFILISLLLISRTIPYIKASLTSISITFSSILETNISYSFLPIYTPSFYFFITCIFTAVFLKAKKKDISISIKNSFEKTKRPFIALIFTLAFVQLILLSGKYESIPVVLANSLTILPRTSFIFISPFIGMFGAFIAGSNTVSNLLFAPIQSQISNSLNLNLNLILSLQVVGGAIGNMIAIHNILAASATVGITGKVREIILKTLPIATLYGILAGTIAYFILF